jgi:hypothetical protein
MYTELKMSLHASGPLFTWFNSNSYLQNLWEINGNLKKKTKLNFFEIIPEILLEFLLLFTRGILFFLLVIIQENKVKTFFEKQELLSHLKHLATLRIARYIKPPYINRISWILTLTILFNLRALPSSVFPSLQWCTATKILRRKNYCFSKYK